ncbi:MAG: hypothetical protein ACOH1Y_10825 [Propionicimonas sp.]
MTRELTLTRRTGVVASLLGGAAGILQLAAGTTPWTGNKNDPVTLGIVTLILAAFLGLASIATTSATTTDRHLAIASAYLTTALLGLTTAGPAWGPAAVAALVAGAMAGRSAATTGSARAAMIRNWPPTLLVALAAVYLSLGLTAMGMVGLLGIAGSVAVLGALAVRTRVRSLAVALLLAGAVPFAVMTYWSLVTPLTGILMIAIGLPMLRTPPTAPTLRPLSLTRSKVTPNRQAA